MHFGTKFIVWCVLTVGIEALFIGMWGVFESGLGPYQCGFIDAGHYCGIVEYILNKGFISNLLFGLPTIISGIVSWLIVREWSHKRGHAL